MFSLVFKMFKNHLNYIFFCQLAFSKSKFITWRILLFQHSFNCLCSFLYKVFFFNSFSFACFLHSWCQGICINVSYIIFILFFIYLYFLASWLSFLLWGTFIFLLGIMLLFFSFLLIFCIFLFLFLLLIATLIFFHFIK